MKVFWEDKLFNLSNKKNIMFFSIYWSIEIAQIIKGIKPKNKPIQKDLCNKISLLKKRKGNIVKIGMKTKKVFIKKANPIQAPNKKR